MPKEKDNDTQKSGLYVKLKTAVDYVARTCVLGAGNIYEDHVKTDGWSYFQVHRYRQKGRYLRENREKPRAEGDEDKFKHFSTKNGWFFNPEEDVTRMTQMNRLLVPRLNLVDPLNDPLLSVNEEHRNMLAHALFTIENRYGNCLARSCLIAKYLWENAGDVWDDNKIHRIEIVATNTFDHAFVIVNRSGNDLHNPKTWGDAWIIDAWYHENNVNGLIYQPEYFETEIKKIKNFAKNQEDDFIKNLNMRRTNKSNKMEETLKKVMYEVVPDKDPYPSYLSDVFQPLEFYYQVTTAYPSDIKNIEDDKNKHKEKFKHSLETIKKR